MKKQDFYYWRLIATGFSFTLFGLGGLALGLTAFPLIRITCFDANRRQRRARALNHWAFRIFIWQMKTLGVLSYDADGIKERLNIPGQLIIANHPTLIDVVFLMAFIEQTNCIVRKGLFNNIFTRGPVRNARYIPNIAPQQLLQACSQRLQQGESLIIFPEGTRTPPNCHMPKLQRGAANIAIAANVKPTPVKIFCKPHTLSKGEKWYHIPLSRPHWKFEVGEDIALPRCDSSPKAARELNMAIQQHFFAAVT